MAGSRNLLTKTAETPLPAWMIAAAAAAAFDFSDAEAEQLDELYHGLWFN